MAGGSALRSFELNTTTVFSFASKATTRDGGFKRHSTLPVVSDSVLEKTVGWEVGSDAAQEAGQALEAD